MRWIFLESMFIKTHTHTTTTTYIVVSSLLFFIFFSLFSTYSSLHTKFSLKYKFCIFDNSFELYIYIYIYIYIYKLKTYQRCQYIYQTIGLMSRVFANDPGNQGSILGQVVAKTEKKKKKKKKKRERKKEKERERVLDAASLNTQHYKVRIKGKVEQSREGIAPYPTLLHSSYWKGSLWLVGFYGISTFVGHSMPNPFLCK